MQTKSLFFTLFLGMVNLLFANPSINLPTPNADVTPTNHFLTLPSPAFLNVTEVGSTHIAYTWPVVPGAMSYNLITKDVATGNIVDVQNVVIASGPGLTRVLGLIPGRLYQSEIRSRDINGILSDPPTFGPETRTVLIDLVDSGFPAPSGGSLGCTINYDFGCPYTWSQNIFTNFKVIKGADEDSKGFRVNVLNGQITQVEYKEPHKENWAFAVNLEKTNLYIMYLGATIATLKTTYDPSSTNGNFFLTGNNNNSNFQIRRRSCSISATPCTQSLRGSFRATSR